MDLLSLSKCRPTFAHASPQKQAGARSAIQAPRLSSKSFHSSFTWGKSQYGRRCTASKLQILATATEPEKKERKRPGEAKGFVEEMRFVAMKLHTKEQAPKEGGRETPAEAKPMAQWQPTTEGYLNFLVQSKLVYETMEEIVTNEELAIYKDFQNTGLERSAALEKDIAWFKETQGLEPKEIAPDSAAAEYSTLLKQLAKEDPPAFICHFYNTYFAHSAGGRMIGKKMSEMLLDGETLEFYQWEGELSELLEAVRAKLNTTAEGWTREQKDVCLEETEKAFQYSGQVMRTLFSAE